MLERERGDSNSNFCGIKVSVYFNGKAHSKAYSFYNSNTKTYLQGEEREPIRKLAAEEEKRLYALKADWLLQSALKEFGSCTEKKNSLKIHLGMPCGYIWSEFKSGFISFAIRGAGGFNRRFPKSYDTFLIEWDALANINKDKLDFQEVPGAWIGIRPTKDQWLTFLAQLISFSESHGHANYSIKNGLLSNSVHEGTHYKTGLPGLTVKAIRIKRKIGGDILTTKINIMTPRKLREPDKPTKTRSFHIYNYSELVEIWPHAVKAYCKLLRLHETVAMTDAMPTEQEFIEVLELGRLQFKDLLKDDPHPAQRTANLGNQKPINII